MKLRVYAVGQRMPAWVKTAWEDYARRMPRELALELHEIRAEPRSGGKTASQLQQAEAQRLQAAIGSSEWRVILDEHGKDLRTQDLAAQLLEWQGLGCDVALLIGGPDGLAPSLKSSAKQSLRLSSLTLPHPLVRVLLAEQLYRAWSINSGHPYHRE